MNFLSLDPAPPFFHVPGRPQHRETSLAAAHTAAGHPLLLGLKHVRSLRVCPDFVQSPAEMLYIQWLDSTSGQWRDFRNDIKQEGQIEILGQALDMYLPHPDDADRERMVASWLTTGIPDHMLHRILKVGQTPDEWASILAVMEPKPPSYGNLTKLDFVPLRAVCCRG